MNLNFGILGAAKIAPQGLIEPARELKGVTVWSVGARDKKRAQQFAETHEVPVVHPDYEAVIHDSDIQAVYIPLPISEHAEWAQRALDAGKHVLCEKSFALNAQEARGMRDAASRSGLVLMDAFHYRYHPLFAAAVAVIRSGEIGKVLRLKAEFRVKGPVPENDIRMIYALGGGVMMDIGCYPVSWARHLLGEEPEVVAARAVTGPDQVDLEMRAQLLFPSGAKAEVIGGMQASDRFKAAIDVEGSNGSLSILNPLVPQFGHEMCVIAEGEKRVEKFTKRPSYSFQLEAFCRAVTEGEPIWTDADDAVSQMMVIDACYRQAGLSVRGD